MTDARLARTLLLLCLLPLAGGPAPAQEPPPSVEGRLLEILRKRGVIDAEEYEELRELERDLRDDEAIARRIDRHVDEMVARMADDATTRYRIGRGFTFETADDRFLLHLGGRIQIRFTFTDFHEAPGDEDGDTEPDFDVPRARVWLRGRAFDHWKYKVQFDVAGDEADTTVTFPAGSSTRFSSRNRLTELKDAHVEYARWTAFRVRAGQFKVPYSRQQLTSSGSLQLVDRAPNNRVFAPARDVGVMVLGSLGGDRDDVLEYYAGAFDGEGENRTNDDEGLLWAGRIAFNPFGGVRYAESDLRAQGERPFRLAVGVNAWLHQDDGHTDDEDDWSVGGDVVVAWEGVFLALEAHRRENGVSGGPDVEVLGWLAQLGYTVVPETLEIGVRVAEVDWDSSFDAAARREYLVVLGWFMERHKLKVQADFGHVESHFHDHADNVEEWRLRIQFQIVF